jgi:hypothetical protein
MDQQSEATRKIIVDELQSCVNEYLRLYERLRAAMVWRHPSVTIR